MERRSRKPEGHRLVFVRGKGGRATAGVEAKLDPALCTTMGDEGEVCLGQGVDIAPDRVGVDLMLGRRRRGGHRLRCIEDLSAILKARGDLVAPGYSDAGKPVQKGRVEAWAPEAATPVGGCFGTCKGYRGRFARRVPPVPELPGLAGVEYNAGQPDAGAIALRL